VLLATTAEPAALGQVFTLVGVGTEVLEEHCVDPLESLIIALGFGNLGSHLRKQWLALGTPLVWYSGPL
jgi:hypothetical protein